MAEYDGKEEVDGMPVMEVAPKVYYPKGVEYRCLPGYSTTGSANGPTKITSRVNSMGKFSPPLPTECKKLGFSVSGRVKSARSGMELDGAKVCVKDTELCTQSSYGFFTLKDVTPGNVKLTYDFSGMIKTEKDIQVNGDVVAGGAADIAMAPKMSDDQWRIVLKWGEEPYDLDSYAFWSWTKVWWAGKDQSSMGLSGNLEVDDVDSYGPETIYLKDVGKCWGPSKMCDIEYMVNDYDETGEMSNKGAEVTLYTGTRVAGHWKISDCPKTVSADGNWWKVLVIDGKTNKLKWNCKQQTSLLEGGELEGGELEGGDFEGGELSYLASNMTSSERLPKRKKKTLIARPTSE
jgi:hypothetical protein